MLPDYLAQKFRLLQGLPSLASGEIRHLVEGGPASDGAPCLLVHVRRPYPLNESLLAEESALVARLRRPVHPSLCPILDYAGSLSDWWHLSRHPGDHSLQDILRQRRKLRPDEALRLLEQLAEALEAATTAHWPLLPVTPRTLFLDHGPAQLALATLRLPAPLLSAPAAEADQDDILATIAPGAPARRPLAGAPPPVTPRDYLLPLAQITCALLGQPIQPGSRPTFRPIPELNADQNDALRQIFTFSPETCPIPTPRALLRALGLRTPEPEPAPAATPAPTRPEPQAPAPGHHPFRLDEELSGPEAETFPDSATPTPAPAPGPKTKKPGQFTIPPSLARHLTGSATRIRLMPETQGIPTYILVHGDSLTLGRQPSDSDYVAQFRPRTQMNDSRTLKISRQHLRLTLARGHLLATDIGSHNPSLLDNKPMPTGQPLQLPPNGPQRIILANEYPVKIQRFPSAFTAGRTFRGCPGEDTLPLQGAVTVEPVERGVLDCRAAWIHSDLAFTSDPRGLLNLVAPDAPEVAGRLHHFAGHFWIESTHDFLSITLEGVRLAPDQVAPLQDNLRLQIGNTLFTIQKA